MKKSLNSQNEDHPGEEKLNIPILGIDLEIARRKGELDITPNGYLKEFYQRQIDSLLYEKELTIKAANSIIKAALKGTNKMIRLCYPSLLKWDEKSRFFQLRTKRRPFSEDVINELGKNIQSISCICQDGIVRIFEIKIEAFWGYGRQSNSRPIRCINIYFSLRDPSKMKNQIPVEYMVN
jgi:hypothetical protein